MLRPGGQLLACVDSLTYGMGVLAEQHRWPHLVDVPNADVVLIPWPDGTITRCYGAEQLRELFTSAGLRVNWIRPRTVLSPDTVSYLLARDPSRFANLVDAELRARSDDSVGTQLIAACIKPGGTTPWAPRHGVAPPPRSPPAGGTAKCGSRFARRAVAEVKTLRSPSHEGCAPSTAPVPLRLARNTASGRRADLEARLGDRVTAVNAPPVTAVVDPGKRGEHLSALRQRQLHRRGVPVRLRQVRARVARLSATPPDKVVFTHQYRNRPVQVGAHFL